VGDFNRDGKLDVVITGAILLGNGDGTFRSTFANVNAQLAIDVNGDGNLDLLGSRNATVQGTATGQLSVQLGNGDGTFRTAINYAAGSDAESVAAGDLNGDGYPDVVISNLRASTVAVLLNNGDGTFQAPVHYAAAVGRGTNVVAVGDFNSDGFLDVAVASRGTALGTTSDASTGALAVLLGKGDGTFRNALMYAAGDGPTFLTVGDVNGDSQPDLLISTGRIWTLLNTYAPGASSTCKVFAPTGN
jgi:hypothetical protein